MKRTLRVSRLRRHRTHGFLVRSVKILSARRKKGRARLAL